MSENPQIQDGLQRFGARVLEMCKDAIVEGVPDIDVELIADAAVECGLIHEDLSCDAEPGDMIYYWGGHE